MTEERSRGMDRREFCKAALAIGGTSALAACQDAEQPPADEASTPAFPIGDPDERPRRQHGWNDYVVRKSAGTFAIPQHQLILGLSYEGSAPPTDEERRQVEQAMTAIDEAYQWGTAGMEGVSINNGLLYMLGYAPRYFRRFGASVEQLTEPETVLEEVAEDPSKADPADAVLVLTADFASILLTVEEALLGDRDRINGQQLEADFEGVFSKAYRRTGVIGKGQPAEKLDNDDVPDEAPLSMGFKSAFADALPTESRMTIQSGPFEGGTTLLVSRLDTHLGEWYDQDHETRVKEMYTPSHEEEDVGEIGQRLGRSSGVTPEDTESIEEDAQEYDLVGHTQKVARARNENFQPVILRRSEGVATDETGGSAFNFTSIQRTIEDFVETRKAMNPEEYDVDVPKERHGIIDYFETVSRGTFLVPPRDQRALPEP